jgi:hypothetical protein
MNSDIDNSKSIYSKLYTKYSRIDCLYFSKHIIKTLITVLFSLSIHIISLKIYNTYCIGEGWYSIIHSLIYIPTPQCRILLDAVKYTSDLYILFWTTLFSSILLNFKIIKNTIGKINYNLKYFKQY